MNVAAAAARIEAAARSLADAILVLLQGEPLRAISYGSAVVIYLVARLSGRIEDVSFEDAVLHAGAAAALIVSVTETARRYVTPAG